MPDFAIVDSHVHLWDPVLFRIPWVDKNELLNKTYGLNEFKEHTQKVDVGAFVYVQVDVEPVYALLEAKWVVARAKEDPRIKGIVAFAPLEYGDQSRHFLAALAETSPLVKGIRRIVQGESDKAFCLRPEYIKGVQLLPEFGFSCDICINHTQLASTVELVKRCPKTRFILDHIGKPNIKEHMLDPWREELKQLAALPNVCCKISGMVTEADPHWTTADLKPYYEHVVAVFGEDRVMFGGDWPVVLLASTYERWVNSLDELTAGLSPAAKKKLCSENARKFYRL